MELEHELSPQTELKLAVYHKDMQKLVTRSVDLEAFFDNPNASIHNSISQSRKRICEWGRGVPTAPC